MSETNTNKSVLDAEENKVNLVKISARISQKIDTVIRDMADEYGVSFSEVVRLAIDGHLEQYLGQVQYMDAEQGKKIRQQCAVLGTHMQAVRNELNRIGVNINQIAKWTNIEAEIVQLKHDMAGKNAKERMEIASRVKYLQQVQMELKTSGFNCTSLEQCVERYEKASEEVSKALWHIQG